MKQFFTSILLLTLLIRGYSQELPYEFSHFTDTYSDLTEATVLSDSQVWDDPEYFIEMPFEFQLFGDNITSLLISGLGSQVLTNTEDPELFTTHVIMPYLSDIMNASFDLAVSPISYKLEGEAGNQILKLEWKGVGFYSEGAETGSFTNTTSFQLWLYEADNSFEYRYGPNTISNGLLVHLSHGAPMVIIGEDVTLSGESWTGFWSMAGNPSNPTVVDLTPDVFYLFEVENQLVSEPAAGTVYRFSNYLPVNTSEQNDKEDTLQLWPTVAQQQVNVQSPQVIDYKVYDLVGKQVLSGRLNDGLNTLSIEPLPSGVYILQTTDGQQIKFMKKA